MAKHRIIIGLNITEWWFSEVLSPFLVEIIGSRGITCIIDTVHVIVDDGGTVVSAGSRLVCIRGVCISA